jgi:hypothetical protein
MIEPLFCHAPDPGVTIQPFINDILVIFHVGLSVCDEDVLLQGLVVERKHIGGNLDQLSPLEIARNLVSETLPQLFGWTLKGVNLN